MTPANIPANITIMVIFTKTSFNVGGLLFQKKEAKLPTIILPKAIIKLER